MSDNNTEPKNEPQPTGPQPTENSGLTEVRESVRVELPQGQETNQPDATNTNIPDVLARGIFQRHMRLDPILLVYIVVLFAGGVYGYVKSESSPSLIAGVVFSILLAMGAYFEGVRKNFYPLIVTLVIVAATFGWRFYKSPAFFPSGLFLMLTVIMLMRHGYIIYLRKQRAST